MNAKEAEIVIGVCLKAVNEQYIMPMMLALGTLTAAVCRDPVMAEAVSEILREQADSCPEDVSGRILLKALSELAAAPVPPDPVSVQDALRASLRLIQGGKTPPKKD
jgi:hypothetical protein